MNYYYDYEFNGIVSIPDCADEYLELISDIIVGYDNCNTVQEFKELVDEISGLAKKARECISKGEIITDEEKSAKSREQALKIRDTVIDYKKEMTEIIKSITPEVINRTIENFTDIKEIGLGNKK